MCYRYDGCLYPKPYATMYMMGSAKRTILYVDMRELYGFDRSYASFKGGDMHGFVDELYHIYLQEHIL